MRVSSVRLQGRAKLLNCSTSISGVQSRLTPLPCAAQRSHWSHSQHRSSNGNHHRRWPASIYHDSHRRHFSDNNEKPSSENQDNSNQNHNSNNNNNNNNKEVGSKSDISKNQVLWENRQSYRLFDLACYLGVFAATGSLSSVTSSALLICDPVLQGLNGISSSDAFLSFPLFALTYAICNILHSTRESVVFRVSMDDETKQVTMLQKDWLLRDMDFHCKLDELAGVTKRKGIVNVVHVPSGKGLFLPELDKVSYQFEEQVRNNQVNYDEIEKQKKD